MALFLVEKCFSKQESLWQHHCDHRTSKEDSQSFLAVLGGINLCMKCCDYCCNMQNKYLKQILCDLFLMELCISLKSFYMFNVLLVAALILV